MKVLIIGAGGQLGKALIKNQPKNIRLFTPIRKELDLSKPDSCKDYLKACKPDWVINAGAFTAVDMAEENKDLALVVNATSVKIISEYLFENGGKLIQLSTDFVFDGSKNSPYKIDDKTSPINFYGKTKCQAENFARKYLNETNQIYILRTSWLMGPIGKNFALTMLNLLANKDSISVVYDQIGSPTSTQTLSLACWQIINRNKFINEHFANRLPILHWCDQGVASWYDVACAIGDVALDLGLISKCAKVQPIESKDFVTLARRPNYSVLDSIDTRKLLLMNGSNWRFTLKEFLKLVKLTNN